MNRTLRYDAIVVGSRCAGAPTAMLLARMGYHVLVLDRAVSLTDPISTHNLVQPGLVMMRRWGLLQRLAATGCPQATSTRVTLDTTTFEVPIPPVAGIDYSFAPRRRVLDALLTDAAREAGADIRLGHSVRSLLWHDGQVAGVVARDPRGSTFIAAAPVVVGADGPRSLVARAVKARHYRRRPAGNCVYYAYWKDVPAPDMVEMAIMPGRAMAIFPTHDGEACVLAARPTAEWPAYRQAPEREYLSILAAVPGFEQRVLDGRRVSRFFGSADLPNVFRQACGPGWALVGDAGLVKDPGPGRGMSDAFRQADQLAAAIDDGLSGRLAMQTALATYGAWRDETFGPVFETTAELAQPTASIDELAFRILRHDQAVVDDHDVLTLEDEAHGNETQLIVPECVNDGAAHQPA